MTDNDPTEITATGTAVAELAGVLIATPAAQVEEVRGALETLEGGFHAGGPYYLGSALVCAALRHVLTAVTIDGIPDSPGDMA